MPHNPSHSRYSLIPTIALCLTTLLIALLWQADSSIGMAAPIVQTDGQTYTVKSGDSLSKISAQFYGDATRWRLIFDATNAKAATDNTFDIINDARLIRIGQKLWIPNQTAGQTVPEVPAPTASPQPEEEASTGSVTQSSISFIQPRNGAVVSPTFMVEMVASGLVVEPSGEINEGAGHMHILVDTDFVDAGEIIISDEQHIHYGKGELTSTLDLAPGEHVLRLQFANGAHIALDGAQYRDEITVTVAADDAAPGVRFVSPRDGATVDANFDVTMAAAGLVVEPSGEINEGAGHMHILVDTDFVDAGEIIISDEQHIHYGKGELTSTLDLAPGEHVLRLQFANGAHIALDGAQYRDEITVTVAADDAAPGVRFVSPRDGATVDANFDVTMAAAGLVVEPSGEINEGAGHMHILVDTDFVDAGEIIISDEQHIHYGKGELTSTLDLAPGEHVLRLQFANGAHIALDGAQYRDEITVTVAADDAAPGVRFVSPRDGATVDANFDVTMAAAGLVVEPSGEINEGAGHMHILVDTDFVDAGEIIINDEQHIHYGKGELTATLDLAPGEHVLRLQFANGAHIALDGAQYQDEITVTVK